MPVYAGASGVSGYIRLTLSIYNSAGTLQNATAVVATVILPDGTTATPSITNSGAGLYHFDYTPSSVGHYGVYWVATGTNAGTLEESFNVDDLTISPPLPLSQVKSHLNIVESSVVDDDELRAYILAATGLIEGVVGPLSRRTVTAETHNGGRTTVLLKQAPIISITSCLENGSALPSTSYSVDNESGVLTRTSGYTVYTWGGDVDFANFNNISVTYVAGRSIIPADLAHAVLELVRHLWTTQRGSIRRSGTDDYVPGSGFSMPNRVREMLNRYQQVN
jgi:uncharacterized phiE125 gp8 family phage protein